MSGVTQKKENHSLLKVDQLHLEIDGKQLLKQISFQLSKNEIVAVVGESGSGKSLLALSLLGLQPKNATVFAKQLLHEFLWAIGQLFNASDAYSRKFPISFIAQHGDFFNG